MKVSDYAKHSVIDMPTAIGMRLAVYRAIIKWHEGGSKSYSAAQRLLWQECLADELLQAAGTTKIVANYYHNLLAYAGKVDKDILEDARISKATYVKYEQLAAEDRPENYEALFAEAEKDFLRCSAVLKQAKTEVSEKAVLNFMNNAPKSAAKNALKSYNMQPLLGCVRWVKNSLPMSGAFTEILGQSTLTQSFLDFTRTPNVLTDEAEIPEPKQLSEAQIAFVERGTKMMRMGDKLSTPHIAYLWAEFDPRAERTFSGNELWEARLKPAKQAGISI